MTQRPSPQLLITSGEPAGIGPDLICQLFHEGRLPDAAYWIFGDPDLFSQRAEQLNLPLNMVETDRPIPYIRGILPIKAIRCTHSSGNPMKIPIGIPSPEAAPYVFAQLDQAIHTALTQPAALITAPIDKSIMASHEPGFRGHTEYFAQKTDTSSVTMMMASPSLRIGLVTTHIPFGEIMTALTPESVERAISHTHSALRGLFGIPNPKLGLCALNPHAGEQGLLGSQEIEWLIPLAKRLQQQGLDCSLPLPPDSAFIPENRAKYDAFIALYHDQGLIPIKTLDFDRAVNITLNLPFIRTSVDHGTAYALAGTGKASTHSLSAAIETAYTLECIRLKRLFSPMNT